MRSTKLPTYPNISALIRQSSELRFPTNMSEDLMFDSLVRAVRQIPDDDTGDAITAVAHIVMGRRKGCAGSLDLDGWGVHRSRVLDAIRDCRTPEDGRRFVAGMNQTAPINENWSVTSAFLQLTNPTVFPVWTPAIAARFGVFGLGEVNSKPHYEAYCRIIWATTETVGTEATMAVSRHVDRPRTPIQALTMILSWPIPATPGTLR